MASELVPDVLSGLVAAGTLALASATVYLGRGAARAAIDAVSPRVVVTWLQAEDEARSRPAAPVTAVGTPARLACRASGCPGWLLPGQLTQMAGCEDARRR